MLNNSSATLANLHLEVTLHHSFSNLPPAAVLTTRMLDMTDLLLHTTLPCLTFLHLQRVHASPIAVSAFLLQSSSLEKLSFMHSYFPLSLMPRGSFPNLRSIGPIYGLNLVVELDNLWTLKSINAPKLEEIRNIPIWRGDRTLLYIDSISQVRRICWNLNVTRGRDWDPIECRLGFSDIDKLQRQQPGVEMYNAATVDRLLDDEYYKYHTNNPVARELDLLFFLICFIFRNKAIYVSKRG
jgi:hypothetical protein